jgi:hypothetical protein
MSYVEILAILVIMILIGISLVLSLVFLIPLIFSHRKDKR